MGIGPSNVMSKDRPSKGTTRIIQCPTSKKSATDFHLCIDADAFRYKVLHPTQKKLRISQLDSHGNWIEADDREYKSFSNKYFTIDVDRSITVTNSVTYLYLSTKNPPKQVLCDHGGVSELYIDMHLKRQTLGPGKYKMTQDAFLLTPDGLILVTFPEAEGQKRPSVQDMNPWYEQSLLPMYYFFASTELKKND